MCEPEKRRRKRHQVELESNRDNVSNATTTQQQKSFANLYFVPGRIQLKRLEILKNCARNNGYIVSESFKYALSIWFNLSHLDTVQKEL